MQYSPDILAFFWQSFRLLFPAFLLGTYFSLAAFSQNSEAIQPYPENPRYWQYEGKPVLLLGGSVEDNLFQIPDLEEHLNLLASVGGNYIRNTMSARDSGNVMPFARVGDTYDLDTWNEEYWNRFDRLLRLCQARDIIVQIELWATWDIFYERWRTSPWNPANNKNYTFENTRLKGDYGGRDVKPYLAGTMHDFFLSVPHLSNDQKLLAYQQKFVDKLLSYSLNYNNILYCMTNEIFVQFSPEWGWYWSKYIKKQARQQNTVAYTTEMYQFPVIKAEQHLASLDHPEIYDFVDISQNAGRYGYDENHWDNLRYAFHRTADHPRPINHVKTYGNKKRGIADVREKSLRSIVGGAASIRFHRPESGLGLNEEAQSTIRMVRKIEEYIKMWDVKSCMDLLSERESDEAYLAANPGEQYFLYFTDGGSIRLDMSNAEGTFLLKWMNVERGDWDYDLVIPAEESKKLSAPGRGGWIAVLVKQ